MIGFRFSNYSAPDQTPFDRLFDIFKQLLTYTSGDFNEAISWLTELDKEYKLTEPDYGIGDFIQDLKNKGYIKDEAPGSGNIIITPKTEQAIRQQALEKIFGKLKYFRTKISNPTNRQNRRRDDNAAHGSFQTTSLKYIHRNQI